MLEQWLQVPTGNLKDSLVGFETKLYAEAERTYVASTALHTAALPRGVACLRGVQRTGGQD